MPRPTYRHALLRDQSPALPEGRNLCVASSSFLIAHTDATRALSVAGARVVTNILKEANGPGLLGLHDGNVRPIAVPPAWLYMDVFMVWPDQNDNLDTPASVLVHGRFPDDPHRPHDSWPQDFTLGTSEVNVITADATTATGGTFTITVNGQTTAAIAFNAAALAIRNALIALPGINAGDIAVVDAGGGLAANNGTATLTWGGRLGGQNIIISIDTTNLIGNPHVLSTTTAGSTSTVYDGRGATEHGLWRQLRPITETSYANTVVALSGDIFSSHRDDNTVQLALGTPVTFYLNGCTQVLVAVASAAALVVGGGPGTVPWAAVGVQLYG